MPSATHLKIELDCPLDSFTRFYQEAAKTTQGRDKFVAEVVGEFTRCFNTESFYSDYHNSRLIPVFEASGSEVISFKLVDSVTHTELLIPKASINSTVLTQLMDFIDTGKNLREIETYCKRLYQVDPSLRVSLTAFCNGLRKKYIDSFIGAMPERANIILPYLSAQAFPAELKFIVGQTDDSLLVRQANSMPSRFFSLQRNENGTYQLIESVCFNVVTLPDNRELASIYVRSTYTIQADGRLTLLPALFVSIEEAKDLTETESEQLNTFFEKHIFSVSNNPVLEMKEIIIRNISKATQQELAQQLAYEEAAKLNFLGHEFISTTLAKAPVKPEPLYFAGLHKRSKILQWISTHKLILSICLFILLVAITIAVLSGAFNLIPALPFLGAITIEGVTLSAATLSAALESLLGFALFCGGILISASLSQRPAISCHTTARKEEPPVILAASPLRSSERGEQTTPGLVASVYASSPDEPGGAAAMPAPSRGSVIKPD